MNELVYWIWLSLCCRPDTSTFSSLLKKFNSAKEVFDATDREISSALTPRSSDRNLLLERDLTRAKEILEFCTKRDVGLLPYCDEKYPKQLRDISTPPVLLYYRGVLPDLNKGVRIAVVGTRKLSEYGRKNAFTLAYDLAKSGATIVSGMATGIDGVAHAGAISADMPTIAVLGSGIDVCYPPEHLTLARNIVKNGCIFSEYPPGTGPTRYTFPQRNRIISGLSSATVVIEGRERSGAVITARYAREQNRTVYAFPGSVDAKNSEASNLLLKNGAKLVTVAEDIIRDFSDITRGPILNPFNLEQRLPISMFDALRAFSVSCVAPSDDIFNPPRRRAERDNARDNGGDNRENNTSTDTQQSEQQPKPAEVLRDGEVESSFNRTVLEIYKKIPTVGDCSVESLADDTHPLREVMRALLKLEMGRFVTLLPGERVMRKHK